MVVTSESGNVRGGSLEAYVRKFNELSTIFDSMPAGVFAVLDQEARIVTVNRTAGDILGMDSHHVVGRGADEIFEKRFPGIRKLINETIENRCPIKNFNLEIENPRGELKTYLVSTNVTRGENPRDFGVILVLHDISEVTRLRRTAIAQQSFGQLIGGSSLMKGVYSLIEKVAQYNTTLLIYGETGTGKELVAKTVHERSPRSDGLFVPVSCSALPSTLLESELFGHVKGAFTGAVKDRRGRFEMATGGTIFLDEVDTLSLNIQVKLLRTIQERVIERVGSARPVPIDVRVVSATNRDLRELVAKGQFREDLYYRLKVLQIDIPPLREHPLDIPLLAESFIERFNKLQNRNVIGLSAAAREQLMAYFWPGHGERPRTGKRH